MRKAAKKEQIETQSESSGPVKLSEGEMELLQLLESLGPAPLSLVHQSYGRKVGLTTIQTRLHRMIAKGVVTKSPDYPTLYSALVETEHASKTYFEMIRKFCGDNIIPFMSHLTKHRNLKPDEIALLKKVIAKQEITEMKETQK
ncbi:MAG: BlaI/MecI/CopY family transcriptional regulator [Thermoguttaceae bacterium]